MSGLHFFSPQWLWALLLVPLWALGIAGLQSRQQQRVAQWIHPRLWPKVIPEWDPKLRRWPLLVQAVFLVCVLLTLARPQWGGREETVKVAGLDVMVVLDLSRSMEVTDVVPSRLLKAKHVLVQLLAQLSGDRVGVVAFAGSAFIASPLTTDLDYVLRTIESLTPARIKNQGTHLNFGIEMALKSLQRGAQDRQKVDDQTPPSQVMVLVSDGEDDLSDEEVRAAVPQGDASLEVKFYVLGVGTPEGGPVPIQDGAGNAQGFKRDTRGVAVISALNESSLQRLAESWKGRYWRVTALESEIQELSGELAGLNRSDYGQRRFQIYQEGFQYSLFLAIVSFILLLSLPRKKSGAGGISGREDEEAGAFGFWPPRGALRKFWGGSVSVFLLGLGLGVPVASQADDWRAYLENERGLKAYQEGRLEEAQKSFDQAHHQDPASGELDFNEGVTQFKQQQLEESIDSFMSAGKLAEKQGNWDLQGRSLYNLGGAQAKKGDLASAARAYVRAINKSQQAHDPELEALARKALELLVAKPEPSPSPSPSQSGSPQPSPSSGDPSSSQKNGSPQESGDQKSPQQGDQQPNGGGKPSDSHASGEEKGDQKGKGSSGASGKLEGEGQAGSSHGDENAEGKTGQDRGGGEEGAQKKVYKNPPSAKERAHQRRQMFHSQKMSQEDAEKVMAELASKEQELEMREAVQDQYKTQSKAKLTGRPRQDW